MRIWMALLAALVLGVAPARADEAKLSAALDAFERMALWRVATGLPTGALESTGGIIRWQQPLRVRMAGRSSSSERSFLLKVLNQAAELANLAIVVENGARSGENFKIEFFPEYGAPPIIPDAGCLARTWHIQGIMTRVELYIRTGSREYTRCILRAMLHGFGIPGHPNDLDSVLSFTRHGISRFTEADVTTLRTLYHSSVWPGMPHLEAMVAARKLLAERMGLIPAGGDASGLARLTMDRSVVRLRASAEGSGRPAAIAAIQLGIAYSRGNYVRTYRDEANRYMRLAGDGGIPEFQYIVGSMFLEWVSPLRDDKAAAHYLEKAALQNHADAMFLLARLLASGRGREFDPVAAYAWFSLAADRKVRGAATARDNLSANLSAAQIAEAKSRAEKFVPQPAR